MYCTKKIASDLVWVGANDRRLAMFEGVYSVPAGVSYNSYLLTGEKTVLFDTVDKAVSRTFFENLEHELGGRPLDYVIVHHMEPDHSATLSELLLRHPETTVVCNDKTAVMIAQFFGKDAVKNMQLVKEGDVLSAGAHELTFYLAPMIHWPEVMMTYDKSAHTLFTADAFGVFGALNGAIFADEVDFDRDYLKEARRYYTNIVGKYGVQVPKLRERGVRTAMYDVSVTPASDIIAECFRWSHLVFASATYNGGIFVTMDELLRDIAAHNLQKRTVAFMENGTWAPVSARQMAAILAPLKNMTVLEQSVAIRSSLTEGQLAEIEALADVLAEGIR